MKNKNISKIVLYISIAFLVISSVIFTYSKMKQNTYVEELNNYNSYINELDVINQNIIKKSQELITREKELNDGSVSFFTAYGFDYQKADDALIQEEIKRLDSENVQIKNSIKDELKKYVHYFDGTYYENENYTSIVASVKSLADRDNNELMSSNIYDELRLDNFITMAKSSGTIGYLDSINSHSNFNNLLLLLTSMYSDNLYEISHDLTDVPDNLTSVYNNVFTTQQVFKTLENFGFKTGTLTSENLSNMVQNIESMVNKYYQNRAIIEKLTGETYENTEE